MGDDYDPEPYERFPHDRYRCPCGVSIIVVGWEVETLICDNCGDEMDWVRPVYHPLGV